MTLSSLLRSIWQRAYRIFFMAVVCHFLQDVLRPGGELADGASAVMVQVEIVGVAMWHPDLEYGCTGQQARWMLG